MSREPMWRRDARFFGPDVRRDVEDEFAFHLQEREAELIEAGLSRQDAREEALRRFGNLGGARAACAAVGERRARRQRLAGLLDGLVMDVRYALRALRGRPGFAACVVLTIALGLGVNAALFSVLNALLLRPLPVERPAELVRIYTSERRVSASPADRLGSTSYADHVDLRGLRRAFAGVAVYMPVAAGLRTRDGTTPVAGEVVSGDYFRVLGVRPAFGRFVGPEEDGPAAAPVAVLSHGFWRRHFGADSSAVGSTVVLNGAPFTVVGVAPPTLTGVGLQNVDVYVPFAAATLLTGDEDRRTDRAYRVSAVIARLAPGIPLAQAQQEADLTMRAIAQHSPETNAGQQFTLAPARSVLAVSAADVPAARIALLLLSVTGVVFVVALLNVAGLVLARATARRHEIAVRLALGAGRGRVARQLLVDGALLALASGACAVAVVAVLPGFARGFGVPPTVNLDVDWRVALFIGGASLVASIVLGLTPLVQVRAARPAAAFRAGTALTTPAGATLGRAFVAAQLALSVLLVVLGLGLVGSLRRQQGAGPGFPVERLLVARFRDLGATSPARDAALATEALRRARSVPGVAMVATAVNAPLTSEGARTTVAIPGYVPARGEDMQIPVAHVGPDYFRTLGVRLRSGEELTHGAGDTTARVVVNAAMARRYWPDRDPVGAELLLGGAGGRRLRIVGVADAIRLRSLAEPPRPTFFLQRPVSGTTLLVRATGDPSRVAARLHGVLANPPDDFALEGVAPMADVVGESLVVTRLATAAVGAFGALTLVLALVGLYGLVSYYVALRTREFGVRSALGAGPRDLLALVLRQHLVLAGAATGVGVALGLGGAHALSTVAPGVTPPDPRLVASATVLLLVVAALASLVPARRANAADPAATLRTD